MMLFNLPLNVLIYYLFLPFLLFYVLIYALLRKSKVLGESKTIDCLTALSISILGAYSIFKLGLMNYVVWAATATILVSFFLLFVIGIVSYTSRRAQDYMNFGSHETEWDKMKSKANDLWNKLNNSMKTVDTRGVSEYFSKLSDHIKLMDDIAKKNNKDISKELPWYHEFKDMEKKMRG